MPRFLLARAVTASAAFPLGLCILALRRGHEIPGSWGKGTEAENIARLDLTDGGVLENLGVQTLLTTKGLARWDLVISDAGTAENSWNPSFQETFKSWFMGHLSRGTLKAVSTLMNNRCDRHMRHEAMLELESSWLAQGMKDRGIVSSAAFAELLREMFPEALFPMPFPFRRRKLLMVRVDQNWKDLLLSIPNWRLVELGGNSVQIQTWRNASDRTTQIELFLESAGRSVAAARDIYNDPRQLGGDAGADTANRVTTHFTSLKDGEIVALFHHARWQIQALKAIYW